MYVGKTKELIIGFIRKEVVLPVIIKGQQIEIVQCNILVSTCTVICDSVISKKRHVFYHGIFDSVLYASVSLSQHT